MLSYPAIFPILIIRMVFGTAFLGKVKEVNKQWIETKFLIIGLPLVPLGSMLVTSSSHGGRTGFTLPLNGTSILAGYSRFYLFVIGLILFVFGLTNPDHDSLNSTLALVGAVLLSGWAYMYFKFGKSSNDEVILRNRIGNATGIYAMPGWLDDTTIYSFYKELEYRYFDMYHTRNWREVIQHERPNAAQLQLIYPLAIFNHIIERSAESEQMLVRAENLVNQYSLSQQ